MKILLADDDVEDLELIEDAIRKIKSSVSIDTVTNGKSVIEYLVRQPDQLLPHLIILDYNMRELNGSEVLSIICTEKRYIEIPKIIFSTSSHREHIEECIKNGATQYFVKPNNIKELEIVVEKILRMQTQTRFSREIYIKPRPLIYFSDCFDCSMMGLNNSFAQRKSYSGTFCIYAVI